MSVYGLRGFSSLIHQDAEFKIVFLIATTLWIYSALTKIPFVVPSHYSDVGWLWIRDVYSGHHDLEIPYLQYELEYPQMIGLLIYVGQAVSTYFPVLIDQYNTFVAVEGILEYPFMIGTVYNLYMLCGKLNLSRNRIYLYMLSTLTFIIYGFYNWDFLVAYFVTISIWLYLDGRFDWAAVTLSLGVLTKFTPGIMIFPMLYGLANWRARIRFALTSAIVWLAVNLPFAVGNFDMWVKLFVGYSGPNHQLQNTWISMAISSAGLGDIISGHLAGIILSITLFFFLLANSLLSKRTIFEKILMTWYGWYGVVYLFDPQMMIQLFPIVVLTPSFNFFFYRVADLLNAFIIMFYFIGSNNPQLPANLTNQLTPFGLTNIEASIRQIIFLSAYFISFNPRLQSVLRGFWTKVTRFLGASATTGARGVNGKTSTRSRKL